MKREKQLFQGLSMLLIGSMAVTEILLLIQGRWREAIPLHLCSISAMVSVWFALFPRRALLDFLWYLGMPGAALALLFPSPASSICQPLLHASYFLTHALILLIPVCRMTLGMVPQRGKTKQMMILLCAIAALAAVTNGVLDTNFLFLTWPPAGTPLETGTGGTEKGSFRMIRREP